MRFSPNLVQPPRIAAWLVNLFAVPEEADLILGDLLEEFSQLSLKAGIAFAQRWYWRQTLKTLAHLVGTAFRTAPWATTAAVLGGFFLRRLTGRLPERAIFSLVDRYQLYEHHFETYKFVASTGIDIGHIISFLVVGCVVASLAKRREMAATMTLALIFAGMAVVGSVVMVNRIRDYPLLWRLTWYFADSLAIVIGGVMVRTLRSRVTVMPLKA